MTIQAFINAAATGDLQQLNTLIALTPRDIEAMVRAENFGAFRRAARYDHLEVINRLIALSPGDIEAMVRAENFESFRWAARYDHLEVINRLIALSPGDTQAMVRAENFEAFLEAATSGHLEVINRLIALSPGDTEAMIRAENFGAFRWAATSGRLEVINRLIALSPGDTQAMIRAENFYAFRLAAAKDHRSVIKRLLFFPEVFAHAEMHQREYHQYTQEFVEAALDQLRSEMDLFSFSRPNAVYDVITSEKTRLYFYIMRHLIRQNTPEGLANLTLLLSIPGVRALAHEAVSPGEPNELLRLAMSVSNSDAAHRLLMIPAVQALAATHGYYQAQQRNGLDLAALARDRESSMRALTQGEQQRLSKVIERYQPQINARGAEAILDELKQLLVNRYSTNSAFVKTETGEVIQLPFSFPEFEQLAETHSADVQRQALESYYQHPDHTAHRYLSKPNPWMSPAAGYVNRDTQESGWSTFEEYSALISLMYLAAKDEDTPAIGGYTLDTRIEQFIKELALIGRAHNWDTSRINSITQQSEEFDDLQGDKPSCFSGVKRRLFQSVHGHPLLTLLTQDIIYQKACEVVRAHIISSITDANSRELHQAWNSIIEGESCDNLAILNDLNMTETQKDTYIAEISHSMAQIYGSELDMSLRSYLISVLTVQKPFAYLAEKFGGQINLMDILTHKIAELPQKNPSKEKLREMRINFFGKGSAKEENTSVDLNDTEPKPGK